MADISKINAVLLANIAEIDDVLAANIAKVNGLVFTTAPGVQFLLDTYTGAAAAYSTRKLKTGVTVAARIRRSGDDIEADVEFDSNNEISLTSPISNASSGTYTDLADFVDHTGTPRDAFIDEWKDQSGSGNHAAQATAANQPQLYDAASGLITENGKPSLSFDGSGDNLQYTGNFLGGSAATGVSVSSFDNATRAAREIIWGAQDTSGARYDFLITRQNSSPPSGLIASELSFYVEGDLQLNNPGAGSITDTNQKLLTAIYSDTVRRIVYSNGSSLSVSTNVSQGNLDDATAFVIGADINGAINSIDGQIQEIVIWNSDQESASNRTGIETDINSNYLIYQPTDAPTSGLLATYTGAAAAYSVRQLSNKAVIALRIRRDSDDEEINIGFDSNGDLATADISAFCGTANGYVTRWWDQSTNGNHADQATDASQPQIYNGTAVITKNGKPALDYDKSNQTHLSFATAALNGKYPDFFMVLTVDSYSNFGTSTLSQTTSGNYYTQLGLSNTFYVQGSSAGGTGVNVADSQQRLIEMYADGTDINAVYDGVAYSRTTGTSAYPSGTLTFRIGKHTSTSWDMDGQLQEYILWPDNQTSGNRSGIESDIMTYFSIT